MELFFLNENKINFFIPITKKKIRLSLNWKPRVVFTSESLKQDFQENVFKEPEYLIDKFNCLNHLVT